MRDQQLMMNFRDCLDFCGLTDLDYKGADYTWAGHRTNDMVWCRLDHFCATPEWISNYSKYVAKHKLVSFSDHHSLVLHLESRQQRQRQHNFRFEFMWTRDEGCSVVIDRAWNRSASPDRNVTWWVKELGRQLAKWNKEEFGYIEHIVERQEKQLKRLCDLLMDDGIQRKIEETKKLSGDTGKNYFGSNNLKLLGSPRVRKIQHSSTHASKRRRINKIKCIKDENGRLVKDELEIARVATDYFLKLFMAQQQAKNKVLLESLQPRDLDNSAFMTLARSYTDDDPFEFEVGH